MHNAEREDEPRLRGSRIQPETAKPDPMSRWSLPLMILAAVIVAAALAWWTATRTIGAGERLKVDHRDVSPFHALQIGGIAQVRLLQGDGESIDVEATRDARVKSEVVDGRLVIHAEDRAPWFTHLFLRRHTPRARVTVRFRSIDAIAISGGVTIDAASLAVPALRIDASGGTSLNVGDLRADTLRVRGSGALSARLGGRVETENVSISGAGSYAAERLVAQNATVSVSGVGTVVVHAERTLDADISGAGVIEYLGNPEVTKHVSGIGRVQRRESRTPAMTVEATRGRSHA